jgi:hypothetical protein
MLPCRDEEGREAAHVEITGLKKEERINDLAGGKTQVDWYKAAIGNVSNNICVDPVDGVKVWATYGEPTEGAYKNIDDLLENLLKHHSRHCVAGEGDYHGRKDCGTGRCLHGRRKDHCKDCRSKAIGNRQLGS